MGTSALVALCVQEPASAQARLRLRDDGKALIEYDGIEYGIAHDLIEAGIAREDILLNMYSTPRSLTEAIAA